MKTYTVKAGKTNFRPLENPFPVRNPKGFEISFMFLPGGWCSKEDYTYTDENGNEVFDKDWNDWQKLKGFTHFFSSNTKRTAILAFRFGEQPETYEVCAYINDKKGRPLYDNDNTLIVEANEQASGTMQVINNVAVFNLATEGGGYYEEQHPFDLFKLCREVGTYAGGANNSPGPYGGQAAKDMSIRIDFKITK